MILRLLLLYHTGHDSRPGSKPPLCRYPHACFLLHTSRYILQGNKNEADVSLPPE